jgi:hypothetical protein
LRCRPVKSAMISEQRLENGEVLIRYPVAVRPWMAKLMQRFGRPADAVQVRKLQLDSLGTAVWDLIDGKRSVKEIIQAFAGAYRLQAREAEVSVTRFVRELGRRGVIGLR